MKKNIISLSLFLVSFCFTTKAQNSIQTSSLTSYGIDSGTSGINCTFYGTKAGKTNIGNYNTFLGHSSGGSNTSGTTNVSVGYTAGYSNTTGQGNVNVGYRSGYSIETGSRNVCLGMFAGHVSIYGTAYTASDNVFIGTYSGRSSNGSRNVFIGKSAGENSAVNDKLFIANSNTPTPLIWGDFAEEELKFNAEKVGINMGATAFPSTASSTNVENYKLFVNGGILATEVRVSTTWADYVFEKEYNLLSINEVESYIKENGHLPNVPSATQVEKEGIEVGEMSKIQQEKIEELTLYTIAQQKEIEAQKEMLKQQQQQIEELKKLVNQLIEK